MKLFTSSGSPFARKVIACATARGIEGQITLIHTRGGSAELTAQNPIGKLPCLITDDGVALYDSRVICEFLDTVGDVYPLFPSHGPRFRALRLQALGDGIMDAAVLRRGEQGRPQEAARDAEIARQAARVGHVLDVLEHETLTTHCDIGTITVACALGYLDLRYADEAWRAGRPKLDAWNEAMLHHPCIGGTLPS